MEPLYQYAWLIPVLPLLGAMIVGIGLISLNKATNSLRQIVAVFIVSIIGATMVLSFALLWSQIHGHEAYTTTIEWGFGWRFSSFDGVYHRSSQHDDVNDRHYRSFLGDDLYRRIHGARSWLCPLLRLPQYL